MAKVYGEIGSLTFLLKKLSEHGINSFSNLNEIINFREQFEDTVAKLKESKTVELSQNIFGLKRKLKMFKSSFFDKGSFLKYIKKIWSKNKIIPHKTIIFPNRFSKKPKKTHCY